MKDNILVFGLSGESVFLRVDSFHKPGETKVAEDIYIEAGGKGHNQAVACKRLGKNVHFVTTYGDDDYGKYCQRELEKEGIIVHPIIKKGKTAFATILTDRQGENEVTVYPGVINHLQADDILPYEDLIKESDVVLLQFELPEDVTSLIIQLANKYHKTIILNPAPAKKYKKLGPVTYLTPNEHEAEYSSFISVTLATIITRGKDATLIKTNDYTKEIAPNKVRAIDTTGAGDVFNGAFAVALCNDYTLEDAVSFANFCASLSVQKAHVINSIPTISEVDKYLGVKKNNG